MHPGYRLRDPVLWSESWWGLITTWAFRSIYSSILSLVATAWACETSEPPPTTWHHLVFFLYIVSNACFAGCLDYWLKISNGCWVAGGVLPRWPGSLYLWWPVAGRPLVAEVVAQGNRVESPFGCVVAPMKMVQSSNKCDSFLLSLNATVIICDYVMEKTKGQRPMPRQSGWWWCELLQELRTSATELAAVWDVTRSKLWNAARKSVLGLHFYKTRSLSG